MRIKRIGWSVAAMAVVLVLTGAGIAVALAFRADPPVAAPGGVPAPAASSASPVPPPGSDITGPLDLLLIGVDTRATIPDWDPHADAIMLLHVDAGLTKGYVTSLPRDLRVDMPAFPEAGFRGGRFKITEAMSRGAKVPGSNRPDAEQGYRLLVRVISDYTGIDSFDAGAVLTFAGMSRLTDALGGITLRIDQKVVSQHRRPDGTLRTLRPGGGGYVGPQATYLPGTRKLAGWQALDYARQRYTAGGDYTRQRHQRQLVKAMLTSARTAGIATDPARVQQIIGALGDRVIYSGERSPIEYAYALRDLRPENLTMVGLPGSSLISPYGGYLGEELRPVGQQYLQAVARDRPAEFLAGHPELVHK
ncbi:MAG TPA: LCP family protein [Actinoplanes sp.]|nr:LCP family protein [Actinoplanes sp.]